MPLPPVLNGNNTSSPELVFAASSLIDVEEAFGPLSVDEQWEQRFRQLSEDLDREENRVELQKLTTQVPFEIVNFALDEVRNVASVGVSHFAHFTQLKINTARNYVLAQMDKGLRRTYKSLASTVIAEFADERGMPYSALFPSGNTNLAKENIEAALTHLADEFPPEVQAVIGKGLAKAALNLVESGQYREEDRIPREEISEKSEQAKSGVEGLEQIQKEATAEAKATEALTNEIARYAQIIGNNAQTGDTEYLKGLAADVLKFNKISSNVMNAAVNLGLSESTAQTLGTLNNLAVGAAQLYLGSMTDPMMAISGGATIVNTLMGGKKSNGMAKMYKQIMKALSAIMRQNQQILENQQLMMEALGQIMANQASTARLSSEIAKNVTRNTELILLSVSGPIGRLEKYLDDNEEFLGSIYLGKRRHTYEELKESIFEDYGDVITGGLKQIDTVLLSSNSIHPILRSETYLTGSEVDVRVDNNTIKVELAKNDHQKMLERYAKRLAMVKKFNLSKRLTSEYASADLFLNRYEREDVADVVENRMGEDPMLDLVADRPDLDNLGPLLDIGMVYKVCKIAYMTHHYYQFTTATTGSMGLKTQDDLLNDDFPSTRGYDLLKKAYEILNTTITQRILLSDQLDISAFLFGVFQGHKPFMNEVRSYKTWDKDFGLLSVYFQAILDEKDFDINNFQSWHEGYLVNRIRLYEYKEEIVRDRPYSGEMIWDALPLDDRKYQILDNMAADEQYLVDELQTALENTGLKVKVTGAFKEIALNGHSNPSGYDDLFDKHLEQASYPNDCLSRITEQLEVDNREADDFLYLDWELNLEKDRYDFFLYSDEGIKFQINPDENCKFNGICYKDMKPLLKATNPLNRSVLDNYLENLNVSGSYQKDNALLNSLIFKQSSAKNYDSQIELLLRLKNLVKGELLSKHLKENNKDELKSDWVWSIAQELVKEGASV